MAEKTKIILTAACRFGGRHHEMGEILEFDLEQEAEADLVAELVHAGRLAAATPENIDAIRVEAARLAQHEERAAAQAKVAAREADIAFREKKIDLAERERKLLRK